ncbi:MAG: MBL fold metallo-hydrolase, partial [Oscillibacter sp.]
MKISCLQVGEIGTNCYLLFDEAKKVCAVVDPGGDAVRIHDAVVQSGCAPVAIFLTHGHYDHVRGVAELQAAWPNIPVYRNHRDAPTATDEYTTYLFPALAGATDYDEGDTLRVGDLTLTVLATPGHSEGSVSLLCGDALFCGDTLFAGSCGRTDLLGGSVQDIMHSLGRLAALP